MENNGNGASLHVVHELDRFRWREAIDAPI